MKSMYPIMMLVGVLYCVSAAAQNSSAPVQKGSPLTKHKVHIFSGARPYFSDCIYYSNQRIACNASPTYQSTFTRGTKPVDGRVIFPACSECMSAGGCKNQVEGAFGGVIQAIGSYRSTSAAGKQKCRVFSINPNDFHNIKKLGSTPTG